MVFMLNSIDGLWAMNPVTTTALLIGALIFVVALLYSTVGHAGASGYLAAMALFGISPLMMKPTALVLNILVAIIGTVRFYRAGFFSWRVFWPFVITLNSSIVHRRRHDFAGACIQIDRRHRPALQRRAPVFSASRADQNKTTPPPIVIALIIGAAIGLLSGLTGVGRRNFS